jgi:8-oxo-dGTP diphosphatase
VADATYDGHPIAPEPPFGATVIVYRGSSTGIELLVLHRAHSGLEEGDWVWTPPAGARLPGEAPDDCARRELLEETGLALPIERTAFGTGDWLVYVAEAPLDAVVVLDSEHDQYLWLHAEDACGRCLPGWIGDYMRRVVAALRE